MKPSDLRLNNTKCIQCLDKEICPACKSPVTEDLLLPSISNPEYCNICKDWDICKGCKIRKPTKDLINDYCKKCNPPEPEKLYCRKCGKKFLPNELNEGICTPCRNKQEEYIKSICLEIDISNLNREASIFTDIQEAFASKGLDTSTSGKIILEVDIPAQKSIWSTEEEVNQWINANFRTQSRKLKYKIVKGFKE